MAELRSPGTDAPGRGPGARTPPRPGAAPGSLCAEQVAQTRAALVAAGRRLFGEHGFAATSVDDLARAGPAGGLRTRARRVSHGSHGAT